MKITDMIHDIGTLQHRVHTAFGSTETWYPVDDMTETKWCDQRSSIQLLDEYDVMFSGVKMGGRLVFEEYVAFKLDFECGDDPVLCVFLAEKEVKGEDWDGEY